MAIYPYKCAKCAATAEVIQSIAAYSVAPIRPGCCGKVMDRVFTVPMISPDMQQSFVSPIDGTVISSRAQQSEHMSKHGVVLLDDIAPDIERNRKARVEEARAGIVEAVVEATHKVEAGNGARSIPEAELTAV